MRLGLVLSLVSALQMAQQSVISELSDTLSDKEIAIVGAAFPAGKFLSTVFLWIHPINTSPALVIDATCLIVGAFIALLPGTWFLGLGRFLMGCGTGIGFVAATVMLYERIEYNKRPAHFCVLGLSFAFATFLMNALPLLDLEYTTIKFIASGLAGACGIAYLFLRPKALEIKEVEDETAFIPKTSKSPKILVVLLMVINVSIGVPMAIGFSHNIFEFFGANSNTATAFSIAFPLLQMVVMLLLYTIKLGLNRRVLIIGGYSLSMMIQLLLLITDTYPFLPKDHHTFFMCSLFLLMIIVTCVPANTALCLMSEQFTSQKEQTRQISCGRTAMWCLATISTASFAPSLHKYGFTPTFIPYCVISAITLLVIIKIYPRQNTVHDFH